MPSMLEYLDGVVGRLATLSAAQRLRLMSILAHNVTVSIRSWHYDHVDTEIDVKGIIVLNEVEHQVTNQVTSLVDDFILDSSRSRVLTMEFWQTIFEIALASGCEGEVAFSLEQAMRAVER